MSGLPGISVLVPSWNYARFLPDALGSLRDQTVEPAEVLVVDDGSTDATPLVAEAWARSRERWSFVRNLPRLGVPGAWNRWLPELRSDWLCIVSADDVVDERFIERHAREIERAERTLAPDAFARLGIVYCYARYEALAGAERPELDGMILGSSWDAAALERGNYIHGSAVFRRTLFDDLGGFPTTAVEEDHAFWRAAARRGWTGRLVPSVLLTYRLHDAGHRNFGSDGKREGLR